MAIPKTALTAMPVDGPIVLRLSLPPSANQLFANVPGKGRVKTKQYRDWLGTAGWELKSQRPGHLAGPVELTIVFQRRAEHSADLDNLLKGLIDLLVLHQVIEDDSLIEALTVRWAVEGEGAMVMVQAA